MGAGVGGGVGGGVRQMSFSVALGGRLVLGSSLSSCSVCVKAKSECTAHFVDMCHVHSRKGRRMTFDPLIPIHMSVSHFVICISQRKILALTPACQDLMNRERELRRAHRTGCSIAWPVA